MHATGILQLMRPSNNSTEIKLYECPECKDRVQEPETRWCDACGVEYMNLSRERDL